MTSWRLTWTKWAQVAGAAGLFFALISFSDKNAWDHEVSAQETRAKAQQDKTNAQMLKEVLYQQRLQGLMLQQQILNVQIAILQNEIERYTDLLLTIPNAEHFWVKEKITQLQKRLHDKRQELNRTLIEPITKSPWQTDQPGPP